MRAGARTWVAVALAAALVCAAIIAWQGSRLRHLAIPTLREPAALADAAPEPLEEIDLACEAVVFAGARVVALSESPSGALAIGLFDRGVSVWRPGELAPVAVAGIEGRRRFVNAVAWFGERLFAATYDGILEIDSDGVLRRVHLPGLAVESLATGEDTLWAGTPRGLAMRRADGGFELNVAGADPSLRASALSVAPGAVWIGTPRGAYVAGAEGAPVWRPLVFGEPGASSNVVTALVATPDGAIAGTDNGGLAWVTRSGRVQATAFELPRANEINPGAAARVGECAVFGTQGAGLLLAPRARGRVRRALGDTQISAVHAGSRLFVGTSAGEVLAVDLPRVACATAPSARL